MVICRKLNGDPRRTVNMLNPTTSLHACKHAVLVSATCSPSCAMVMLIPNFGEKKKIFNQHPLSDIRLRLLTPNVLKC